MEKILVILTGGTIGSESDGEVLSPDKESCCEIIDLYRETYNGTEQFDIVYPVITLSENMLPEKWEKIFDCIIKNLDKSYKGIIVTHGSDTLSFTSTLAGVAFSGVNLPIVFTAANRKLSDPLSNGLQNFKNAVCFVNTSDEKGVFVSYSNHVEENDIYLAVNLTESSPYNDEFSSFDKRIFGKIVDGKFKRLTSDYPKKDVVVSDISFKNKVLLIRPYPGLSYDNINLTPDVKAVVHYLYHSATACVDGEENSILKFIKRCKEKNIDFYISSLKKNVDEIYSSLDEILSCRNVKKIYNSSPELSYAKVLLSYNQKEFSAEEFFEKVKDM